MISVIIPALNEARSIGSVVRFCINSPGVSEVIVVDDKSIDDTARIALTEGAKVITSTKLGKGASMRDGVLYAKNEILVFLDGDINPYPAHTIHDITHPLINGEADFIKASFSRTGGRVTELVAKPLLSIFFHELTGFNQPLGGVIAGKKSFFSRIDFFNDYGVDIGILIDMHRNNARIQEVNIGYIENDSKPLKELGQMSKEVAKAILSKAHQYNSDAVSFGELESFNLIRDQMELAFKEQLMGLKKMAFFDMDNTILQGRFIDTFARVNNLSSKLREIRKKQRDPVTLTKAIAKLVKGYHIGDLVSLADTIPLVRDTRQTIDELHQRGYIVGIITDSYDTIGNHIKNKIGADFCLANELEFSNSIATGEVKIPSFFFHSASSTCSHTLCKTNAMKHILNKYGIKFGNSLAIGDSVNDLCMLQNAGMGVAFCSTDELVNYHADSIIDTPEFKSILEYA